MVDGHWNPNWDFQMRILVGYTPTIYKTSIYVTPKNDLCLIQAR